MDTRGYEYNQICVCVNIIMGSQMPIYYTRGYPFSYPPHAHDRFYPWVPVGMGIFATLRDEWQMISDIYESHIWIHLIHTISQPFFSMMLKR